MFFEIQKTEIRGRIATRCHGDCEQGRKNEEEKFRNANSGLAGLMGGVK